MAGILETFEEYEDRKWREKQQEAYVDITSLE